MAVFSGYGGRVRVGTGTILPAVRWQVVTTMELEDVTHVGDALAGVLAGAVPPATAQKSYLPKYADTDVTVDVLWDSSLQPFQGAAPPAFQAGAVCQADLFHDRSDATARFSLSFVVETISVELEVRGVARFTVSGKQSGYGGSVAAGNLLKTPGS